MSSSFRYYVCRDLCRICVKFIPPSLPRSTAWSYGLWDLPSGYIRPQFVQLTSHEYKLTMKITFRCSAVIRAWGASGASPAERQLLSELVETRRRTDALAVRLRATRQHAARRDEEVLFAGVQLWRAISRLR